jgi:dipeptidyl aminopeptidase/acylaminoacyl peptidase
MKLFFTIVLLALNITVSCQNTSLDIQPSNRLHTDKWDLDKYVWSQRHTATAKGNKPALDYDVIDNYIQLGQTLSISPDGLYFSYETFKGNIVDKKDQTLIIQSTTNTWKKSYLAATPGFFSANSKQYIFKHEDDLCFLQTGSDHVRYVKQITSFKQSTNERPEWLAYQLKDNEASLVLQSLMSGKEKSFDHVISYNFDKSGKWLAYQLNNDEKQLVIYNLKSGIEKRFPFVESYYFSINGESLAIKTRVQNNCSKIELQYIKFPGEIKTVWSTTEKNISISNYTLDNNGNQLAFVVKIDLNKESENSIWYYKTGMVKAVEKVNNQTVAMQEELSIQGPATFTDNSSFIQFSLQPKPDLRKPPPDAVQLDVWNHKDLFLQSAQLYKQTPTNSYKAVINLETDQVIRIEKENEKEYKLKGDFAIVRKLNRDLSERFWEKNKRDSNWLISLKDGYHRLLPTVIKTDMLWFSPGGNYLVYFDGERGCHYYSYDLRTGKQVKISAGIPDWLMGYQDYYSHHFYKPNLFVGIVGWLESDAGLLVYDNYDIWKLDLSGRKRPVNITNGYGRRQKILLSLMQNDRFRASNLIFKEKDTLLLTAFNMANKYNGFYRAILGLHGNPDSLNMGPYFFQFLMPLGGLSFGMVPRRAFESNTWIVRRESPTEAPNYFLTTDFRVYNTLTNLQPPKTYNWLTTELRSFKQLDGTVSQGVLYKPENFDPSKKYPVIISFYFNMSNCLYQFPTPEYLTNANIIEAPAWMVSHGYLVFLPDIYFIKGQYGPSTVNTIVGAAKYLSQLPFVDNKRMSACGHSNSGRFGYYLLTHSKCFAAMAVGSATSNMISSGFSLWPQGTSKLKWSEENNLAFGLGGSLWQNKESWLDHSNVIQADKVTSPVLIFQNKKDIAFTQGIEMFSALWRLEKSAWLLQYDNGGHTLETLKDMKDYTIRYTQFFDHFLKGAPAPIWMTKGIRAAMKGIETGYALDPSGNCASYCKYCRKWNEKYKQHPEMFLKPGANCRPLTCHIVEK